ncbi:MBL fold metallo-hydrolase [Niallia sp. Sow4_A1]|uniref:MBL fold metallo-hydrolase n=1 Tax=Niallia hominis TaxID=3133173 RepID=A0ABV1EV17_9BACI|nr:MULTISPECIES: MBL fold metallo-hydrolase [Bacillaceae]MCF2646933.1 MBL fold metallo-hydrolase [Niallia circulans]MCM3360901.1 MBL fold metallo-hydrolase [Niallia sp. MER TA 168]CAI9388732.1 Hydroxyacylglutathione hydrolase GloC [Bacillus sp. T2.9-1]
MEYKQIPLGPIQTNCYLVWNEKKDCLVIDPGANGVKLNKMIQELELSPIAILLTHAHFDHIGAVEEVRTDYSIPVYVHSKEEEWLIDPKLNGSEAFRLPNPVVTRPAEHFLDENPKMTIGDFTFQVMETPGHSPGSVTFYFKKENWAFVGDALFYESIGRTDLIGGNQRTLINSIHEKLLNLPEETIVLSGHGRKTTIEHEMDHNPYINGF